MFGSLNANYAAYRHIFLNFLEVLYLNIPGMTY